MLGRGVTGRPALRADVGPARRRRHHRRQPGEHARATLGPPNPVQGDSLPRRRRRCARDLRAAGFDAIEPGQQPHRRLRRRVAGADRRAAARGRAADVRRRARPGRRRGEPVVLERHGVRFGFLGFNAIGETAEAAPGQPGALSVEHAAAHRAARPPRARPGPRRRTPPAAPGRRRRGAAALGRAVHPPAGPVQHRVARAAGATPAPTWSSAATRTGCRAPSRSATRWSCTRSATSSSTWTS